MKCLATEMNTLPIFNKDFAIENKTQTQQTKYSKREFFVLVLTWKLQARNRLRQPSSKSSFDARDSPSLGWTVLATSISSLLLEYDVSQLSVELAEGRYTSLSVIISRVFQRWLIQNYKRCERFVRVNWEFSQFSTSSPLIRYQSTGHF